MIRALKVFYHYWMAISLENHTDHVAVKHVKYLAELNNCWGVLDLAHRYHKGKSIGKDLNKAAFYYKKAFETGGKEADCAAYNLGAMYLNGEGVKQDIYKSVAWNKKAAYLGYPASQYNYGLSLYDGWCEVYDEEEGLLWIKKAADSGMPEAKEVMRKVSEEYNQ